MTTVSYAATPTQERIKFTRAVTHEGLVIAAITLVALVLRLWPVHGVAIDYQDEGVYWQSLRLMTAGYPLFSDIFASQPPFFLLSLFPIFIVGGQTLAAARLGVVLYSMLGLGAAYVTGRAVGGRWTAILVYVLLALDPLFLTASHTLQAEGPALAWAIIGVALAAHAWRYVGWRRRSIIFASGVAVILGIMSKLFDVVAVVPIVLYLCHPHVSSSYYKVTSEPKATVRACTSHLLFFGLGGLAAGGTIVLPFYSVRHAFYDQVVRFHQVAEHTYLAVSWRTNVQLIHYLFQHNYTVPLATIFIGASVLCIIQRSWSRLVMLAPIASLLLLSFQLPLSTSMFMLIAPHAILLVVALYVLVKEGAWTVLPPLLWCIASFVILIHQQPLFEHQIVLLVPPIALLIGTIVGLAGDQKWIHGAMRAGWIQILLIVAVVGLYGVQDIQHTARVAAAERRGPMRLARTLAAETSPNELIATDNQYVATLAGRRVVPQLVDTSQVRIASGYIVSRYMSATVMESLLQRYHVRVILFAGERFGLIPGFTSWVEGHYNPTILGPKQTLYVRKGS